MTKQKTIMIPGAMGQLEALLDIPAGVSSYKHAAVVCHPHPQFGGTMHNKVAYSLAKAFCDVGIPALRFNFRGVNKSAGEYDQGQGEVEDLDAAVYWAQASFTPENICLAGFSFGGGVAFRHACRAQPACLVTVSPAVRYLSEHTDSPDCPWLLIQGEQDDVVPTQDVLDWWQMLGAPGDLKTFPEAGHFFHGQTAEIRSHTATWLRKTLILP